MFSIPDLGSMITQLAVGCDPFDITGALARNEPALAREIVEEAINGVDAVMARRIVEALEQAIGPHRLASEWMPIDRLTARIMAHAGVDPLVATWTAIVTGTNLDITDDQDDMSLPEAKARIDATRKADDEHSMSMCTMGSGIRWFQHGVVETQALPETMAAAMAGRRLREVISHPILDMEDLVIEDAQNIVGKTIIIVDYSPKTASITDLIATAPHGCR